MPKCLIVDDEEQNRYLLDVLLRGHGYETMVAANGEDALKKARINKPELIISDIMMPVMDGFQFCRECKTDPNLKEVPFVFYTAQYTEKQDEKLALALGADRFIIKPQEPETFLAIMNEVLSLYQQRGEAGKSSLDREAFLSAHDERIVKKLEEKMADLEKMNQALRESEEKYRLLAENVHDIIFVLGMDLHYSYISPSIKFLRGYEPVEMLGHEPSETMTSASWELAARIFTEEIEQEKSGQGDSRRSRTLELEMLRKDGTTVWMEGMFSLLRNDQGKPTGILGVTRDITERKKSAEALDKSFTQLRNALVGTVQAMASLVETRDPYTSGHQRRVTGLAVAIGQEMILLPDQIDGLHLATMIHDIGKISIPTEILVMTRKLSNLEFGLIKIHSQAGYDILKEINFPWPIARIIQEHHERMDGSGYPNGLTGNSLLLESRILAVADVVEAMASHRPYRPALGIDAALKEISENSGLLYDSAVVDACVRLFKEKDYRFAG